MQPLNLIAGYHGGALHDRAAVAAGRVHVMKQSMHSLVGPFGVNTQTKIV